MIENPYRYTGPLDPDKDKIICAPRSGEINKVIGGIKRGDYWSIMGPRQIGKTTFLFQLSKEISPIPCIYINFEIELKSQEAYYQMIINEIMEKVPAETVPDYKEWEKFGAEFCFYNFLKSLISRDSRQIVFMFDEIGRVSGVISFLHLWRKIFHDRNYHQELEKYTVIISGAHDLISLTYGPMSPFNISRKLVLSNLEREESENLIDIPMKALNIKFEPGIKEELISRASGHPQLLQHLCSLLVEKISTREKKEITGTDLVQAIEELFKKSGNMETLKNQIKTDEKLHHLVQNILDGEKIKYLSWQEYSQVGVGPIIEDKEKCCKLRNPLYEEYLAEIMDDLLYAPEQLQIDEQGEFITTVYCSSTPVKFDSQEQEKEFLKQLFSERVKIEIEKNGIKLSKIDLSSKEKLLLCYLAYKNYKAVNEGFSDWKSIPITYKYRVSSNLKNNSEQKPEWEIFEKALGKAGVEYFEGSEIKAWTFSIRKKLATINARDLIHSGTGKGRGYLLIGTVRFKRH
ncbi:MAG: AAA family ATPase [Candidatus Aminicenantes bacterium]|nr:AAA family ATPase [Candidatus Aminicenantes bacterium]NIM78685.1 AAA family ATPase [Candidatus Aminicenantes bacterium]NIN17933.1 AAA family ATPase [Candidatus Aminicenantes bacterium]NIN41836.1 AAA family ATPase [Candidatus Aminicenantes bacterium]NIN84588.1 AAA family ATPase [Candidatus Aminicenantes bacterium]